MALLLTNGILVDLDPLRAEHGSLRIDNGKIVARGNVRSKNDDEVIDCRGAVVMPGIVNGHTHLYSALAAGMPMPREPMRNFHEILKYLWWRLDCALDPESIELSARIGALDALHCGTTTLIDHHASPNHINGSLDLIEDGIRKIGPRAILCYETTDRNGMAGRDAGLEENSRYISKCAAAKDQMFAGLIGAHASFTCGEETLQALGAMARELDCGIHIHVAEDRIDEEFCRRDHGMSLIDRLDKHGMLRPDSIFGHCTHLDDRAIARINEAGTAIAHNTRSNMNNAVGYTRVAAFTSPVLLGTDGIGANMFNEAQTAWFKSRDGHAAITPNHILAMLANNATRASNALGVTLGKLQPGAEADINITSYIPATPLTSDNIAGHLVFAMGSQHVKDVLVAGKWVLRNQNIMTSDEERDRAIAREKSQLLWERVSRLGLECGDASPHSGALQRFPQF